MVAMKMTQSSQYVHKTLTVLVHFNIDVFQNCKYVEGIAAVRQVEAAVVTTDGVFSQMSACYSQPHPHMCTKT